MDVSGLVGTGLSTFRQLINNKKIGRNTMEIFITYQIYWFDSIFEQKLNWLPNILGRDAMTAK